MTTEETKRAAQGIWQSIAVEVRPSKNPDGTLRPFFLKRHFVATADDRFVLTVTSFGDPYGKVPLARLELGGHMAWLGDHPVAPGAQKVDFVADETYTVTPLAQGFADLLNSVTSEGYARWAIGQTQSILGNAFAPFGLVKGEHFKEFDLVYVAGGMLFWGARHIDGRGFDSDANRPTNLQIPMLRTT